MAFTLQGPRHGIAAGHHLAAAAGFRVLEQGGNAFAAGIAAGAALGVLMPDLVSFGGVAPIILRTAAGEAETVAGLGPWPRALPHGVFGREHGGRIPEGVRRTVVPAAPDAWLGTLLRRGRDGAATALGDALRLAEDGFAVNPLLHGTVAAHRADYARWPSSAAVFLPGGAPPAVGTRFRQPALARTIRAMLDEAARHPGPEAGIRAARDLFYRGDIAREICRFVEAEGGWLRMADLADYASPVEAPVRVPWRGHAILCCGAWCQGPALPLALNIAEAAGIAGHRHNGADYLHILAESLKLALADRECFFGDPRFVEVPLARLLSPAHARARARAIRRDRAHPGTPGLPEAAHAPRHEPDTSFVATVDRWGNSFAATPSDPSWDAPVVPALGFVASSRGSQSRPDPAHPAGAAPGKRPRLTPCPAIIELADGGVMPFGSPGGDVQVQAMMQVALNVLVHGMDLQDAVEAPRVATYALPSSFAPFEAHPGMLAVEAPIPDAVREDLSRRGHRIHPWPERSWLAGAVQVVRSHPAEGLVSAAADPRRPSGAVVG